MSREDPAEQQGDPADGPDGPVDHFAPPTEPCECWCLHCRRTFMSTGIWFQRIIAGPPGLDGFWMCPTPNCDGKGFTFDIYPTDPDHPGNDGWCDDDGDDGEAWDEDDDLALNADADESYDPNEAKWKQLDEDLGEADDDDLEGEEWKHGLQPGERPPEPDWMEEARREQAEAERRYDEPDRRPREVDWSDRDDDRQPDDMRPSSGGGWTEDDIPF
jgi:hypothetical protein